MHKKYQGDQTSFRAYPRGLLLGLLYLLVAALLTYIIAWAVWLQLLSMLIKSLSARSQLFEHPEEHEKFYPHP